MQISNVHEAAVFNRMNVTHRNYDNIQAKTLSFTNNDVAEDKEEKKKKFSFKKATNIAGVAAWLALVVYGAKTTKIFRKNSPEMLEKGIKEAQAAIKAGKENIEYAKGPNKDIELSWLGKKFYSLGNWVQNATNKFGKELFNNFIYAFGTLVVMPTVVLLSPTKKEDSKKGDKFFTILRQPFSVAATLIMQFTFDKVLSKKLPDVIKYNMLENKEYLHDNGHFIKEGKLKGLKPGEILEKIKYNTADAEEALKLLTKVESKDGGLKGLLTEEELKEIFDESKLKSYEKKDFASLQKKLFDKLCKNANLDDKVKAKLTLERAPFDVLTDNELLKQSGIELKDEVKTAAKQIKNFLNIHNRKEIVMQRTKVGVNVVLAAPIACTFLNVIYGKGMKLIRPEKKENVQSGKEVK